MRTHLLGFMRVCHSGSADCFVASRVAVRVIRSSDLGLQGFHEFNQIPTLILAQIGPVIMS